ncbi:MAG: hypothetical protein EOP11_17030 [Proteobacteria bacterium]|nr:MAG: hypothetical protein EOP11_17030 [Pseudomonadota bacterium]
MTVGGQLIKSFSRVRTGIPGLDTVLGGGVLKGGIYLIMGTPGAGKTIVANQFGFNHVEAGGRALYVSLLSESHSRLFGHLKAMRFFNEERISQSFNFVSAYHVLEKEGLDGLLKTLAQTVRQYKADLLFIDGVASAEDLSRSQVSFKKFVHDLNTVLSTSGCTAFLLSSLQGTLTHPEHTMVDGIISLTIKPDGLNNQREISVTKLRGSNHLQGRHHFRISNEGISVFPRVETYLGGQFSEELPDQALISRSFGVKRIDQLFGGGLVEGSVTSLIGAAGTGKTLLGTTFLAAGAAAGETSYYYGFYESPPKLVHRAAQVNADLSKHLKTGRILLDWQPPFEIIADELVEKILARVDAHKVKRFFLDGAAGLRDAMVGGPDRLPRVLTVLTNELRKRGVTVIFTEETELFSASERTPVSDHSAITDNIVHLRYVALNGELHRLISVQKTREGRPHEGIHEFKITDNGIDVAGLFPVTAAKRITPKLNLSREKVLKKPSKKPGQKR